MPRALGTALRIVLLVLGGIVMLIGAGASVLIGSDDTAQTGPHDVFTPGVAIITDAEALHYVGPTLHLTVAREDGAPVFVGVANEVDAGSYLGQHSHRVVDRVKLPWTLTANETGSGTGPLPTPSQQPWWIDSAEGAGAQELVWPIPHGRYVIAVLNADGTAAVDVQVTLGLEIEGAFYAALAVTAFGLALVLVGLWLWIRARRRRRAAAQPDESFEPDQPDGSFEPSNPSNPSDASDPGEPVDPLGHARHGR